MQRNFVQQHITAENNQHEQHADGHHIRAGQAQPARKTGIRNIQPKAGGRGHQHGNALFALRIQIHRRKFIIKYQFWLCVVKLCIRRGFLMIFTGFFSFW